MPDAIVKEVRSSGAVVELVDDGREAWMKAREFSAAYRPGQDFSKLEICKPGDRFAVVIMDEEVASKGPRLLVSRIRADHDPWEDACHWEVGDFRELEVLSVTPTRAYGRAPLGLIQS